MSSRDVPWHVSTGVKPRRIKDAIRRNLRGDTCVAPRGGNVAGCPQDSDAP